MAHLEITCPGQPDAKVELSSKAVTIGRAEDAEVFIPEKKSSRAHLRIAPLPSGDWVAEDLGSANGTLFEGHRVMRHLLGDGDELRIGDTSVRFVLAATSGAASSAAPAIQLGGSLAGSQAQRTLPGSAAPEAEPAEMIGAGPGTVTSSEGARAPRRAAAPRGRFVLPLLLIGLAAIVGEHYFLGGAAKQASDKAESRKAALELLRDVNLPYDQFAARIADYEAQWPRSPFLNDLEDHLEYTRERDEHMQLIEDEFARLSKWTGAIPASELRTRFLSLIRRTPDNERFHARVQTELRKLDHLRGVLDTEAFERLSHEVGLAFTDGNPGRATRLLAAFRNTNPGLRNDALDGVLALERRAQAEAQALFDRSMAAADKETDEGAARTLLAKAGAHLAGTEFAVRIATRVRTIRRPGETGTPAAAPGSTPGATPPREGPGSTDPDVEFEDTLLAKAEKAQDLILTRQWLEGRQLLAEIADAVKTPRLKAEWQRQKADIDRILQLTQSLGAAAAQERKPYIKTEEGRFTITAADERSVTLTDKSGRETRTPWGTVDDALVLVLLEPKKPTVEERMALALVAADLSDKEAFVRYLAPLFDKKQAGEDVQRLVALRLYGRTKVPEGGYQHYGGQLVDRAGFEELKRQEHIASLRDKAEGVLVQMGKQAAFKKLAKLTALRDELDKRREYALRAIFNEKHYPYPANKGATPYRSVQNEVDARTAAVKEIWDDPYSVKISRKGPVGKLLDDFEKLTKQLEELGEETKGLKSRMEPYSGYVSDRPITVRRFFRNQKERELLAYNEWVMSQYNPARTEYASQPERNQVLITNEYRTMIGFMTTVTPGAAPFESIDETNVKEILDAGASGKLTPLKAVRVDNRLTTSARLHSLDMQKRGYFSHFAKPNPGTGQGQTSPHQRMNSAGYQGWGSGENIANGPTDPARAHWMWIHSSGHHRNILSNWEDLGSGQAGRLWTQNFASGGGGFAKIQPDTEIHSRKR
jgi:uncharacterized protein YkwD